MNNETRRNAIIEELRSLQVRQAELLRELQLTFIDTTQQHPTEHRPREMRAIHMTGDYFLEPGDTVIIRPTPTTLGGLGVIIGIMCEFQLWIRLRRIDGPLNNTEIWRRPDELNRQRTRAQTQNSNV